MANRSHRGIAPIALLCVALLLGGCGQKGGLVRPEPVADPPAAALSSAGGAGS